MRKFSPPPRGSAPPAPARGLPRQGPPSPGPARAGAPGDASAGSSSGDVSTAPVRAGATPGLHLGGQPDEAAVPAPPAGDPAGGSPAGREALILAVFNALDHDRDGAVSSAGLHALAWNVRLQRGLAGHVQDHVRQVRRWG